MTDQTLPDVSEILFSTASKSISHFLTDQRRAALSQSARLSSIEQDSIFVKNVQAAFALPLVANERCGSWYIDPRDKVQGAYFKSTDGHAGQWRLSLRRLNLQVLETIAGHHGCIIVDSTRRGKSMPDALSKTLPIWICIWNRMLFPDDPIACALRTPEDVVPPSEHSQMHARLTGFLAEYKALNINIEDIRAYCKKPMMPIWVTHTAGLAPAIQQVREGNQEDYYRVVLCTASRHLPSHEAIELDYIQGAADDHESWAQGLTAPVFWRHKDRLLQCSDRDLPDLIAELVATEHESVRADRKQNYRPIKPTDNLFVGSRGVYTPQLHADALANLYIHIVERATEESAAYSDQAGPTSSHTIELVCPPGKLGSRALRHELAKVISFVKSMTKSHITGAGTEILPTKPAKLYVTCSTGKDHSIGVALAVLCLYFSDGEGRLVFTDENKTPVSQTLDKQIIKRRLGMIMQSMPDANPSRATLQSVNAFLLS